MKVYLLKVYSSRPFNSIVVGVTDDLKEAEFWGSCDPICFWSEIEINAPINWLDFSEFPGVSAYNEHIGRLL